MSATQPNPFVDYVKYFFTGYRTDAMSAYMISLLTVIRYAILLIIGALAQGLADQFSKGNYALDFATIQGYIMPAVVLILGYIWKFTRETTNPFLTASKPPAPTLLDSAPPR